MKVTRRGRALSAVLMVSAAVLTVMVGSVPTASATPLSCSVGYVSNTFSDSVSLIDPATATVLTTVSVGAGPLDIAFSPSGDYVYVLNHNGDNMSVIATSSNTVVDTIGAGASPRGIALTPDGTMAYVSDQGDNTVSVINLTSGITEASVNVGLQPWAVVAAVDGSKVYVSQSSGSAIDVIDTATNTVTTSIVTSPGGISGPRGMTLSNDGALLYVVNGADDSVSVIDTSTDTVIGDPIDTGSIPTDVVVSPDGGSLYVTELFGNTVSKIDLATGTRTSVGTFNGAYGIAMAPEQEILFASASSDSKVAAINTAPFEFSSWLDVGSYPSVVRFSPGCTPTIAGVSPSSGSLSGGETLTITGYDFGAHPIVTVGGQRCTSLVVVSAAELTCVVPAGVVGAADVVVQNYHSLPYTRVGGYTYVDRTPLPPTGATSTPIVLMAAALLVFGTAMVRVQRRRVAR